MKLSELKFGDKVYYGDGELGVVVQVGGNVTITWEDGMTLSYESSLDFPDISLEPPKRKVKHNADFYVSDCFIEQVLKKGEVSGFGIFVAADSTFKNKITDLMYKCESCDQILMEPSEFVKSIEGELLCDYCHAQYYYGCTACGTEIPYEKANYDDKENAYCDVCFKKGVK